jgi:hypothetical protein
MTEPMLGKQVLLSLILAGYPDAYIIEKSRTFFYSHPGITEIRLTEQ